MNLSHIAMRDMNGRDWYLAAAHPVYHGKSLLDWKAVNQEMARARDRNTTLYDARITRMFARIEKINAEAMALICSHSTQQVELHLQL